MIVNTITIIVISAEQNHHGAGLSVRHLKGIIMTRTQRKRAKKERIAIANGLSRLSKRINETAKAWARILTADRRGEELWGRLAKCPHCLMFYCYCYGGSIAWCAECRFYPCLKITEPQDPLLYNQCNPCRWEEKCNEST